MMSKKLFINHEIGCISFDGKMNLSTVSDYMKIFLTIIENDNKSYHICYRTKTPIEIVYDKPIVSLDQLNIPN